MLGVDGEILPAPVGKGNGSLLRGRSPRQETIGLYPDVVVPVGHVTDSMGQECRRRDSALDLPSVHHHLCSKKICDSNVRTYAPSSASQMTRVVAAGHGAVSDKQQMLSHSFVE